MTNSTQNVFPSSAVLPATATLPEGVTIGAYNSRNDRRNLFSQTDLVWESRLGGVDQTLLFGFEAGRQKSRNHRQSGTITGLPGNRAPLADPTVDVDVTFASSASDANNRTRANILAFYVQDQIRPTDWLEIVAGSALRQLQAEGRRLARRKHATSAAPTDCGRRGSA